VGQPLVLLDGDAEAERPRAEAARVTDAGSGVDVMITIFSDFRQFSAKIGVFLKNQCYDQNFA
jgi:hypothetical protein